MHPFLGRAREGKRREARLVILLEIWIKRDVSEEVTFELTSEGEKQ